MATVRNGGGDVVPVEQRSVLIPEEEMKAIIALDNTLRDGKREIEDAEASGSLMLKGMMTARVTQQIRQMITPKMMGDIMALMNTPLGFRTDRDPARPSKTRVDPYPVETVRDVVITALMDGARIVGNEFNIICGNYYRTKEQLERRVKEFPGLREFLYSLAVPVSSGGSVLVAGWASWKLNGKADRLDCTKADEFDSRIPVRVNEGMGADAVLGKATRKLFARVLKRLAGDSVDFEEEESTPEATGGDESSAGKTADASYTVTGETESAEPDEHDPVFAFEERFAGACNCEYADELMAAVVAAGFNEQQIALAKSWHTEALQRITGAEVESAEQSEPHPLDGVWDRLQACQEKKVADAIYLKVIKESELSEDDLKLLNAWLGQTKQRIHDSRGARSNKPRQTELQGATRDEH